MLAQEEGVAYTRGDYHLARSQGLSKVMWIVLIKPYLQDLIDLDCGVFEECEDHQ